MELFERNRTGQLQILGAKLKNWFRAAWFMTKIVLAILGGAIFMELAPKPFMATIVLAGFSFILWVLARDYESGRM